jgi:hypothetical protein
VYNQRTELTKVPEAFTLNNALPLAPMNKVAMLTGYVNPAETYIADPNQDVLYRLGCLSLEKEPVVIQVPDFGDRFWTVPVYDARTDQIGELGFEARSLRKSNPGALRELEGGHTMMTKLLLLIAMPTVNIWFAMWRLRHGRPICSYRISRMSFTPRLSRKVRTKSYWQRWRVS